MKQNISIPSKVRAEHLNREALVYVCQSTMSQVRFNQESTQRQYALQEKAIHDSDGKTIMDPDEEVQHAVFTLFRVFRSSGSAYGVVRYFAENDISFPKRAYGGAWDGKISWDDFEENQKQLESNCTSSERCGSAREGAALLTGSPALRKVRTPYDCPLYRNRRHTPLV